MQEELFIAFNNLNGIREFDVFCVEEVGASERVHDDEAGLQVQEGLDVGLVELVKLGGEPGQGSTAAMLLNVLHVVEEVEL